jgi:hypothetical protein
MKKLFFIYLLLFLSVAACKKDSPKEIIENIKPYVELINPVDRSYVNTGDTIFVTALAGDEDGSVKTVLFYKNSQVFAIDSTPPWENYTICSEQYEVTISVIAIDNRDALSEKMSALLFVVEDEMPVVYISKTPYDVLEHDSVVFTIDSYSPNGNITNVDFYLNDNLYGSDTSAQCVFTVKSMALGEYKAYAIVEDEEGKIKKSQDLIFSVNLNQAPTMEFHVTSYSGYFPGHNLSASVEATDDDGTIDSVFIYVNDSLYYATDEHYIFGANYLPPVGGDYSFHAICRDDRGAFGYSDTIVATIKPGYVLNGKLVDLTYSNSNDLAFGLDQTNNKLLLINPLTTEKEEIALPHSQPVKFYYSMIDEKLYIIYKYDGVVSVWDNNTQNISEISFSTSADAIDIEVDEINRRVYALATNGLNIINQNNGDLINTTILSEMYDIAINPSNRWLFACSKSSSIVVKKYNVGNDVPELMQNKNFFDSYRNQIRLNQKYNYFIISGLGDSQTSLAIDINDLNNTVGEFSYNEWYNYSNFTPDENFVFTGLDNYDADRINVMNAGNYTLVDQIVVPNSNLALMTTNYDQKKLVVFSYEHFYEDGEFALYFFDIDYQK